MKIELTTDQKDLVQVIRERGGATLGRWAEHRLAQGYSFDTVARALADTGSAVASWRIGRGV